MTRLPLPRQEILNPDGLISSSVLEYLGEQPDVVLLESALSDRHNFRSYLFVEPNSVIKTSVIDEVDQCLRSVEAAIGDGCHAAGFVSYEAGAAFEATVPRRNPEGVPLAWFGIYEDPMIVNHRTGRMEGGRKRWRELRASMLSNPEISGSILPAELRSTISREEHESKVQHIKDLILAGDTYQVNLTFGLRGRFLGTPAGLYRRLREVQRVSYAGFLNTGDFAIISCSPELFFRVKGDRLTLKPMKGTAPRGRTLTEDRALRAWLDESQKDRAENLMIVDLLRNDAGRVASTGSVKVKRYFDIEKYDTLYQATSTIEARLRSKIGLAEIMRRLFPSGSVTGAPKIRTMQIIHELEQGPRGVYTGAIGFVAPKRKAVFSVAIRTAVISEKQGTLEYGVGSGIVHDSLPGKEYEECLLKGKILHEEPKRFELLETIKWSPQDGWLLLEEHLNRLRNSATYFRFRYDRKHLLATLRRFERYARNARAPDSLRVRLTVDRDSNINLTHSVMEPLVEPVAVCLSFQRTDSSNPFFFHKTTRRDLYDRELEKAIRNGWFDMIFLNDRGEVTEGARTNIVVRKSDTWSTPPVSSGLLDGVYRRFLFHDMKMDLRERVLYPIDLTSADGLFVCNAVRGLIRAVLVASPPAGVQPEGSREELLMNGRGS